MMKKFCDSCGNEITKINEWPDRLLINLMVKAGPTDFGSVKTIQGFAILGIETAGTDKRPDVCKFCVFDAIASADKRPRAA